MARMRRMRTVRVRSLVRVVLAAGAFAGATWVQTLLDLGGPDDNEVRIWLTSIAALACSVLVLGIPRVSRGTSLAGVAQAQRDWDTAVQVSDPSSIGLLPSESGLHVACFASAATLERVEDAARRRATGAGEPVAVVSGWDGTEAGLPAAVRRGEEPLRRLTPLVGSSDNDPGDGVTYVVRLSGAGPGLVDGAVAAVAMWSERWPSRRVVLLVDAQTCSPPGPDARAHPGWMWLTPPPEPLDAGGPTTWVPLLDVAARAGAGQVLRRSALVLAVALVLGVAAVVTEADGDVRDLLAPSGWVLFAPVLFAPVALATVLVVTWARPPRLWRAVVFAVVVAVVLVPPVGVRTASVSVLLAALLVCAWHVAPVPVHPLPVRWLVGFLLAVVATVLFVGQGALAVAAAVIGGLVVRRHGTGRGVAVGTGVLVLAMGVSLAQQRDLAAQHWLHGQSPLPAAVCAVAIVSAVLAHSDVLTPVLRWPRRVLWGVLWLAAAGVSGLVWSASVATSARLGGSGVALLVVAAAVGASLALTVTAAVFAFVGRGRGDWFFPELFRAVAALAMLASPAVIALARESVENGVAVCLVGAAAVVTLAGTPAAAGVSGRGAAVRRTVVVTAALVGSLVVWALFNAGVYGVLRWYVDAIGSVPVTRATEFDWAAVRVVDGNAIDAPREAGVAALVLVACLSLLAALRGAWEPIAALVQRIAQRPRVGAMHAAPVLVRAALRGAPWTVPAAVLGGLLLADMSPDFHGQAQFFEAIDTDQAAEFEFVAVSGMGLGRLSSVVLGVVVVAVLCAAWVWRNGPRDAPVLLALIVAGTADAPLQDGLRLFLVALALGGPTSLFRAHRTRIDIVAVLAASLVVWVGLSLEHHEWVDNSTLLLAVAFTLARGSASAPLSERVWRVRRGRTRALVLYGLFGALWSLLVLGGLGSWAAVPGYLLVGLYLWVWTRSGLDLTRHGSRSGWRALRELVQAERAHPQSTPPIRLGSDVTVGRPA